MDSTTSKTNLWLIRAFALSAASWYQCNHHFIIAMIWLPVKSQVPGQQTQCALKYKKHQIWRSISQFSPMRQTQTLPACLQHLLPWDQKYSWLSLVFFLYQKQCKRSHIYCLCLFVLQWQSTSSISKAVRSANFYCRHRHFWFKCYWIRLLKKNSGKLTWYLPNLLHKRISDNMKIWGNLTVLALSLLSNAIFAKSNCCNCYKMFEIILKNVHHKKFYTSPAWGAYDNYHACLQSPTLCHVSQICAEAFFWFQNYWRIIFYKVNLKIC